MATNVKIIFKKQNPTLKKFPGVPNLLKQAKAITALFFLIFKLVYI